jgi:hypothetical protein
LRFMRAAHKAVGETYGTVYADRIAGVHGGFLFPEEPGVNDYSDRTGD